MVKNLPANADVKRCRFDPWFRKMPWRRKWQATPVFLPGESHGQRRLVGDSLWGRRVRHDRAQAYQMANTSQGWYEGEMN